MSWWVFTHLFIYYWKCFKVYSTKTFLVLAAHPFFKKLQMKDLKFTWKLCNNCGVWIQDFQVYTCIYLFYTGSRNFESGFFVAKAERWMSAWRWRAAVWCWALNFETRFLFISSICFKRAPTRAGRFHLLSLLTLAQFSRHFWAENWCENVTAAKHICACILVPKTAWARSTHVIRKRLDMSEQWRH